VRSLPPSAVARARQLNGGGWVAVVDCGPNGYVSDADAPHYGPTAEDAMAQVHRWLLDDLACGGRLGKPQYQPHWDNYDVLYRLGDFWRVKAAGYRIERELHVGWRWYGPDGQSNTGREEMGAAGAIREAVKHLRSAVPA
jgi:hypothetical protein